MKSELPMAVFLLLMNFAGCNQQRHWDVASQFQSFDCSDPSNAWLVTLKGNLLSTRDAGAQWKPSNATKAVELDQISFISGLVGWALSKRGQVLRTTDAGTSWVSLSVLDYSTAPFPGPFLQIKFVDELHGWVVDPFSVWRTDDGGTTWTRHYPTVSVNGTVQAIMGCFLLNPRNGWLCGSEGLLFRTDDGGKTWNGESVGLGTPDLHDVFFLDERLGWVTGWPDGGVFFTKDGGETWHQSFLPGQRVNLESIWFVTRSEGWAVGINRSTPASDKAILSGVVLHSTDGGEKWRYENVGETEVLFERVRFLTPLQGWIVARDKIYRSNDGGKTWRVTLALPPILR